MEQNNDRCINCVFFNAKGDSGGYCLNKSFHKAIKAKYDGDQKGSMPNPNREWREQKNEIEEWTEIHINGDVFKCIFFKRDELEAPEPKCKE